MPTYEYQCKKCGAKFDRIEHVKEHDTSEPACPECDNQDVEQVLGTFFAKTARKS